MNLCSRLLLATLGFIAVTLATAQATVTIQFAGGYLKDRGTTGVPYGTGTLLLVASTADASFTTPSNSFNLSVGSAVQPGSDDVVLFKSSITGDGNQSGTADAGEFRQLTNAITLGAAVSGTVAAGNPLILYWFPTVSSTSTNLNGGEDYGAYRSPVAMGGTDGDTSKSWYVPSDGTSAYNLVFRTSDTNSAVNSGTSGIPFGQAIYTVIPEPSTWMSGVLLGVAACFGLRRACRSAGMSA